MRRTICYTDEQYNMAIYENKVNIIWLTSPESIYIQNVDDDMIDYITSRYDKIFYDGLEELRYDERYLFDGLLQGYIEIERDSKEVTFVLV